MPQHHSIDLFIFKAVAGVDDAAMLSASACVDGLFGRQPGFVSRRVFQAPGGLWVDQIEFATAEQADAAAAVFGASADCDAMKEAIDMASVQMFRLSLVT